MKRKILKAMEDVREELELEHQTKKRIRIEKIKINSELLKLKKLISSKEDWSEEECVEFDKIADSLSERVEELKGLHEATCLDIKAKEIKFNALIEKFDSLNGTEIFPFEVLKMLEKDSKKSWRMEWIHSYEGNKIGYAFVREDDQSFEKNIIADYSLADSTIYIDNSASRKVVYADLKYDANDVMQSWDWMEFYLYAVVGIWKNDIRKEFYQSFIERDYDFAENVCALIRQNFMKTDEEIFDEIISL